MLLAVSAYGAGVFSDRLLISIIGLFLITIYFLWLSLPNVIYLTKRTILFYNRSSRAILYLKFLALVDGVICSIKAVLVHRSGLLLFVTLVCWFLDFIAYVFISGVAMRGLESFATLFNEILYQILRFFLLTFIALPSFLFIARSFSGAKVYKSQRTYHLVDRKRMLIKKWH